MNDIFPLDTISPQPPARLLTGLAGFDCLLGGGLVEGSAILISGTPGSGKSTLLMQVAYQLAAGSNIRVLYVSGEENKAQIKMRAERLLINSKKILLMENTQVEKILKASRKLQPKVLIIDSIQMLFSEIYKQAPGTPTQLKYGLLTLMALAKKTGTVVIFVGHSTKGGFIAGLQTLQHMVDVTLYLGVDEEDSKKRFLKTNKNRFGAIDFVWQIIMTEWGLTDNPEGKIPILPNLKNGKIVTLTSAQIDQIVKNQPIWKFLVNLSMDYLRKQVT